MGVGVGVGVAVGVGDGVGVDCAARPRSRPVHQRAASTPDPRIATNNTIPASHRFDLFTGRSTGTFMRLIIGELDPVETLWSG